MKKEENALLDRQKTDLQQHQERTETKISLLDNQSFSGTTTQVSGNEYNTQLNTDHTLGQNINNIILLAGWD